ncbi:hypothetical protein AB0E44_13670, partial [Micrococcus terreus]|uniref:hypothetical protein n=1 Tax=Micrococcus terreus TaxID=574650 RepID=UPI0033DCC6E5
RTELVADALRNTAATTHIAPDAIWHSDRESVAVFNRSLQQRLCGGVRWVSRRSRRGSRPIGGRSCLLAG